MDVQKDTESSEKRTLGEPDYVLDRIQRGLVGYISYLAACDMNPSFSEYVLYEPILRILIAQGYRVECEYPLPKSEPTKRGDYKRIDFVAFHTEFAFALEVKWIDEVNVNLAGDIEKLNSFIDEEWKSFLCIFGRKSHIKDFKMPQGFKQNGKFVCADLFITKYGCKIYELTERIEIQEEKKPVKAIAAVEGTLTTVQE